METDGGRKTAIRDVLSTPGIFQICFWSYLSYQYLYLEFHFATVDDLVADLEIEVGLELSRRVAARPKHGLDQLVLANALFAENHDIKRLTSFLPLRYHRCVLFFFFGALRSFLPISLQVLISDSVFTRYGTAVLRFYEWIH